MKGFEDRCPYMKCRCADCPCICELSDHMCVLELDGYCDVWNDNKKEFRDERKENNCS